MTGDSFRRLLTHVPLTCRPIHLQVIVPLVIGNPLILAEGRSKDGGINNITSPGRRFAVVHSVVPKTSSNRLSRTSMTPIGTPVSSSGPQLPIQSLPRSNDFVKVFPGRNTRVSDPLHCPDLSLSVIKLLGAGEYAVEPPGGKASGHFGLAVKDYTHASAPNHQYPDLITHRLLKAAMAGKSPIYALDDWRSSRNTAQKRKTLQEGGTAD